MKGTKKTIYNIELDNHEFSTIIKALKLAASDKTQDEKFIEIAENLAYDLHKLAWNK